MSRPEVPRALELRGQEVDGDDLPGAGQASSLNNRGADSATAEDGNRGPRFHLGRVQCGANPGGDGAANKSGTIERDFSSTFTTARA